MSEARTSAGEVAGLSGIALLELAVTTLLAESPVELPEQLALDRARSLLACTERLAAVRLAAIRDVDRRELFVLDAAGSTRGWLRTQPGGEGGQLSAARRLEVRPTVEAALAAGELSARAAEQVCAVLDRVPSQVAEPLLTGVLLDGVGGLLQTYTGGLVPDDAVTAELLAARAEVQQVLQDCAAATASTPAGRLEPALVLLARRVAPSHLGPGLRQLLEALLPDGSDGLDRDPYFFELRELLDGDVDVRGHLTPEVGHALAAEVARRMALADVAADAAAAQAEAEAADNAAADDGTARADAAPDPDDAHGESTAGPSAGDEDGADEDGADEDHDGPDGGHSAEAAATDQLAAWDAALAAAGARTDTGDRVGGEISLPRAQDPARPISAGRRRHDALAQLLHDLADVPPGSGRPTRPRLTIIGTLGALEGRLGAPPAQLTTHGPAATLSTAQLQRLACSSDLDAVLLDALGNPVGASHTRRNLTARERRALRAQWGPTCAVAGCPHTSTVPHHVEPYWLTGRTRLRDIIPACEHCHHDLHDGHRTLRLRDGRLINELGWVRTESAA